MKNKSGAGKPARAPKSPPGKLEWGNIDRRDLDLAAAYEDYFGRTCAQLHARFIRAPLSMVDSLRWMPLGPFKFYLKCLADFISEGNFDHSQCADLASAFIDLINEKLVSCPAGIAANATTIRIALSNLSKDQYLYAAQPAMYGSFSDRCRQAQEEMDVALGRQE